MAYKRRSAKKRQFPVLRIAAVILPLVFLSALLSQTAFAKTYVITDGDQVVTYTTFATDPAEVLSRAGLTLSEEDTYTTEGRSAITIRRANNVELWYHGEPSRVTSGGETVGALLTRLNLDVEQNDVVSHPLDAEVEDGMELRVDTVIQRQETYTTTLAHETAYCNDASIPAGEEAVLIEGQDGELLCTANVSYVNGQETAREVLSEYVSIPAVEELVAVGTGDGENTEAVDPEGMPIIGDGYIQLPTGEVLTYTRKDTIRATAYTHTDAGCDMITSTGTTVRKGTVAVDPRYIPYGTRMFIVSNDGEVVYGIAVAEDCGGDIKGDRMDLYYPTFYECMEFGRRVCTIYFLG